MLYSKRKFQCTFYRYNIFSRDLREHSSSTITIESEVARRMITANTKVHNHRRRVDMILFAFDRRIALPKWMYHPWSARETTRRFLSVSSFPSSRDLFRRYTTNRDKAEPFCYLPRKCSPTNLRSPNFVGSVSTFARKMTQTENRAKSNGEITGSHRFIEKWTFPRG